MTPIKIRDVGALSPHTFANILFGRTTSDVILTLLSITFVQTNIMIRFPDHPTSASTAFPLSVPGSIRQTLR